MFHDATEQAARVVNAANQSLAVVYGFDPSPAADPAHAASFMVVAEQTGGAVIPAEAGLPAALDRILREQDGYYRIDFRSEPGLPRAAEKFAVRVKREPLTVRSRTGFMAKPSEPQHYVPEAEQLQLLHAVTDPFSSPGIPVRLTSVFASYPDGSRVDALLHIEARHLGFIRLLKGAWRFNMSILLLICTEDGRIVQESIRGFSADLTDETYRHILAKGLVNKISAPLWLPGPYQVRAIVADGIGGNIGFGHQFLEAPDARQFSLSSMVVMGEKLPNPMFEPPGVQLDATSENPAVRVFRPGQSITYSYEVITPPLGPDKKPVLEAQTRLFREGQVAFEGKSTPVNVTDNQDAKRYFLGGKLILSSQLETGDYILHIAVTSKLDPNSSLTLTQVADFRIQ